MSFHDFLSLFSSKSILRLDGKYLAIDVAKYVITKCTIDKVLISNLQLQKILYYLQREFLQKHKCALFPEEIEAWAFGPVVRDVYYYFCGSGAMSIFYVQLKPSKIAENDITIIDKIVEEKRILDPWELVRDTHSKGKAWDLIYQDGLGYKEVIPKEWIAYYG